MVASERCAVARGGATSHWVWFETGVTVAVVVFGTFVVH